MAWRIINNKSERRRIGSAKKMAKKKQWRKSRKLAA